MNILLAWYGGLLVGTVIGIVLGAWLAKMKGSPKEQAEDDAAQLEYLHSWNDAPEELRDWVAHLLRDFFLMGRQRLHNAGKRGINATQGEG